MLVFISQRYSEYAYMDLFSDIYYAYWAVLLYRTEHRLIIKFKYYDGMELGNVRLGETTSTVDKVGLGKLI